MSLWIRGIDTEAIGKAIIKPTPALFIQAAKNPSMKPTFSSNKANDIEIDITRLTDKP